MTGLKTFQQTIVSDISIRDYGLIEKCAFGGTPCLFGFPQNLRLPHDQESLSISVSEFCRFRCRETRWVGDYGLCGLRGGY